MNRDEIINRVAAIVLAIVLWVYVISVVNPPTTVTVRQVPVTLLNQDYLDDSKLAIAGDGKYTVDVDLSGKRKDLILGPSAALRRARIISLCGSPLPATRPWRASAPRRSRCTWTTW